MLTVSSVCRRLIFAALLLVVTTPIAFAQNQGTLLKLDVSGRDGADARNGTSYSGSAGTGSNGADGGNATESESGKDAGSIDVTLHTQAGDGKLKGVVIVTAKVKKSESNEANPSEVSLEYGQSGYIYLEADGGHGGNGGRGGDGQNGGDGYRGSDATRYSSGGNGGNGGDGGDGGRGSDGSPGGKGGVITIRASEKETGLLMLVRPSDAGGKGGSAGQNGRAGRGGSGGQGGSSYSWTENDSYTDSEGNTHTNTTYHSNSGGSSGSSGRSGSTPSYSLSSGRDAEDGKIIYSVENAQGVVQQYDSMYSLVLQGFDFAETDTNHIFEPGEIVNVQNIRVKNVGGMPTPPNQDIRIYISNHDWVLSEGEKFAIPHSLAPGEEYTVPMTFHFKIKNTTITTDGPRFTHDEFIRPMAEVTDVARTFDEFHNDQTFEITYPIEMSSITSLRSLSAGQKSKLMWKIKNVSTEALGVNSDFKRQVLSALKIGGGDLDSAQVKFYSPQGNEIDILSGHDTPIPVLNAGDEMMIEGVLEIGKNPRPYTSTIIRSSLRLDALDGSAPLNLIQNQTAEVRVSQTYKSSKNPGILLVTNHGTTEPEILAWKKMSQDLGLSLDVWDLSYYGELRLTDVFKDTGSTLEKDFKGKTIVLLNNSFETSGRKFTADEMLARKEFLHAAGVSGINFLAVGGTNSEASILENYLIPTTSGDPRVTASSVSSYLSDVAKAKKAQTEPPFGDFFDRVEIGDYYLFGRQPKEAQLRKQSEKLYQKLNRLSPEERSFIVYTFDPKQVKKSFFGMIHTYDLGALEVRRGVNNRVGLGMSMNANDESMHEGEFVSGEGNKLAVLFSLSPQQKVEIFNHAISDSRFATNLAKQNLVKPLIQSILAEITAEQAPFRAEGSSRAQAKRAMRMLNSLLELKPGSVHPDTSSGAVANQLLAELNVMASSQLSWYDYLAPWQTKFGISRIIRSAGYRLRDHFYSESEDAKAAKPLLNALRTQIKGEITIKGKKPAEVAMDRLLQPVEGNGYRYSSLSANPAGEIISMDAFEAIVSREKDRSAEAQSYEELMKGERCELLME